MSDPGIPNPPARDTISTWLERRVAAVRTCLDSSFPEEALVLLYSAIATLAFLGSAQGKEYSDKRSFIDWCNEYIVASFGSHTGGPRGIDLYGARCGVLHLSSAMSSLGQRGKAREIWYQFRGQRGLNLETNTPKQAMGLDVEALVAAFEIGSRAFLEDLRRDGARYALAMQRAQRFFTWAASLLL
jgi:hypothetical protein